MHPRKCVKCNSNLIHYEIHDAFFCPLCNTWVNEKCDDSNGCEYCDNRPKEPLDDDTHNEFLSRVIQNGYEQEYFLLEDALNE